MFLQMSEAEETGWRAAGDAEAAQEEKAAAPTEEEDEEQERKEELQQRVQARAEDLGGEEASLIKDTEEGEKVPITETKYEPPSKKVRKKTGKPSKSKAATPKNNTNLISMSKQLEKQSKQLARIEKVIQSLQSSFNNINIVIKTMI